MQSDHTRVQSYRTARIFSTLSGRYVIRRTSAVDHYFAIRAAAAPMILRSLALASFHPVPMELMTTTTATQPGGVYSYALIIYTSLHCLIVNRRKGCSINIFKRGAHMPCIGPHCSVTQLHMQWIWKRRRHRRHHHRIACCCCCEYAARTAST